MKLSLLTFTMLFFYACSSVDNNLSRLPSSSAESIAYKISVKKINLKETGDGVFGGAGDIMINMETDVGSFPFFIRPIKVKDNSGEISIGNPQLT